MQRALGVEILVTAVDEAHDILVRGGHLKHPLAHGERHDVIAGAMQDEDRGRNPADAFAERGRLR